MANTNTSQRYFQDDDGQWWYRPSGKRRRGKAYVGLCEHCGGQVLARSSQRFCSYRCKSESQAGPKVARYCKRCNEQILSKHARKYCSHECAALDRHSKKPLTTPKRAAGSSLLLNSDNPRYSQDEKGQ